MDEFSQSVKSQMNRLEEFSVNGKSIIVFMPIKPAYANEIIKGSKKFEFRRSAIRSELTHIIIYSSCPVKKIIGIAEVGKISSSSPSATWEDTKHAAGIPRKVFRRYFKGSKIAFAIGIERVIPFERWVDPKDIVNGFKVPQTFSYVDDVFFRKIVREGLYGDEC